MHGLIFTELRKYVTSKYGFTTWETLLEKANLDNKVYLTTQVYPDSEILNIVDIASKATGLGIPEILEDFGKFLVPDLFYIFSSSIRPEWKMLDMLEQTEKIMHRAVRAREPQAKPPHLVCKRISANKVEIVYTSARKICPLAIGLIKGVADHYKEKVKISEPACMLRGDSACKILVEL